MWRQWSERERRKPQATELTRSPRRTDFTINMTAGIKFVRCVASTADEKKLRKTAHVVTDTGLNVPKRKQKKRDKQPYEEN